MPFRSKAQQGFLFAKHPVIAKRFAKETPKAHYKTLPKHVKKRPKKKTMHKASNVSPDELTAKTPTHVKTLKLLGPTDPPTQEVKTCYPESESLPNMSKTSEAQAMTVLCIAGLTKEACDSKAYEGVATLTKLAQAFAHTGSLHLAIKVAYPQETPEKRELLRKTLVDYVLTKRAEAEKDAGYLVDAANWMEAAPGKAWEGVKGFAGNAWQGLKNIARPVTDFASNVGTGISNFGSSLMGAMRGARQGWSNPNGAQPQAPAVAGSQAAPATPPVSPQPAPAPTGNRLGAFTRKIGSFKLSETTMVSMPSAPVLQSAPKNIPSVAPKPKTQVRYSFRGAPANRIR